MSKETSSKRVPIPWPPPARPEDGHKGTFGRVLLVAGSWRFPGAAILAARAALRGGAGLVTIALPDCLHPALAPAVPSATWLPLASTDRGTLGPASLETLFEEANLCNAIAIGPGLGRDEATGRLVVEFSHGPRIPLVIDADGLYPFSGRAALLASRPAPTLLTPHPGEMRRLTNKPIAKTQAERERQARALAIETRSIVVLKGAGTVVSDGERLYVNQTGNSGMGTGGTGDVLTGLLTSILAQGVPPFEAASAAVWLHGLCGDLASKRLTERALIADDLIESLGDAHRIWEESGCS